VESQLIGYFTAYTGLNGFLRWNYTVWPERPRERLSYKYPNWKSGDTNFVYPGYDGKPLLSIRYKNLKRGIEAFELIQILKRVAPNAQEVLEKVWNLIFRTRRVEDFHPQSGKEPRSLYSLDYQDYQNARQILLEEIEKSLENR